ncbi:MAG: hypothetical protein K2X66_14770, partial [Cyanobacteria bacterium]|nr:hypothetical protein [Cyanobacteriota bacterium]
MGTDFRVGVVDTGVGSTAFGSKGVDGAWGVGVETEGALGATVESATTAKSDTTGAGSTAFGSKGVDGAWGVGVETEGALGACVESATTAKSD